MLELKFTSKFKKDYKRIKKQGLNVDELREVLDRLCHQETLPSKMHDHPLTGNYAGHRECHIEPDWLLIYRVDDKMLVLTAVRTGSHSELLNM